MKGARQVVTAENIPKAYIYKRLNWIDREADMYNGDQYDINGQVIDNGGRGRGGFVGRGRGGYIVRGGRYFDYDYDDYVPRGRGGFGGRGRGGFHGRRGRVQRPRLRPIRYLERMRREEMYRRPVNLLDIDRPEVEIEVPMWFVEMEEI